MEYKLSLSPDYVPNWEVKHAVRELLQNVLDQERTGNPNQRMILEYDSETQTARIGSKNTKLPRRTLLLGGGDKRAVPGAIGSFGEGYKLAMLVCARELLGLTVRTGGEIWTARMKHCKEFDCNQLVIDIGPAEERSKDLLFEIEGISSTAWNEILSEMYLPNAVDDTTLRSQEMRGRVYVGGLFVRTVRGLSKGYNFAPGRLKLNRDRDMVTSFEVEWEASKIWETSASDYKEDLYYLLEKGADDVRYLTRIPETTERFVLDRYLKEHGDAVPISSHEAGQMKESGTKFSVVPDALRQLLRRIGNFKLEKRETPQELLQAWAVTHGSSIKGATAWSEFKILLVESEGWYR